MSKTLQGQDDERAEREEAEMQREQEARAQMEMMRAQEMEGEGGDDVDDGEGGEGEGEGEEPVDLDAEVPDADADVEWSSDDEDEDEDVEDEEEAELAQELMAQRQENGMQIGVGAAIFDGPSTPVQDDDRTPQRFRLNPFQAPTGEGDGDYGSPLAARHAQRAATARVGEVSPGVMAAVARRGQRGVSSPVAVGMDVDLDDAIPMDETMIEEGSDEHDDTEVEDGSSGDDALHASSSVVGSISVFRTGAIGAAVRRISGQERRASGGQRRASGDRRVSGDRRASGRPRVP